MNDVQEKMNKIAASTGAMVPNSRPNSHLYNVADKLAEEVGWKVHLKWEQNGMFPALKPTYLEEYARLSTNGMSYLTPEQKTFVYEEFMRQINTHMVDNKKAAMFPVQMFVFIK